ncbi:MAG: hypothetical protein JXA25_00490 [Anaerolineales bacterium]|nr:hypothetical protein [Anaerolineales bacterium]
MKCSTIYKGVCLIFMMFMLLGCSTASISESGLDSDALDVPEAGEPLVIPDAPAISCPEIDIDPIVGFEVTQVQTEEEPAARTPYLDAVFNTCIIRVTDRHTDIDPDDPSPGLKNEYSRVQSFNADGSLLLARGIEGTWYLYNAASLQPLGQLPLEVEPRWSSSDPMLIYYIDETRLMFYNISTGQQTAVHEFRDDLPGYDPVMVWTRYESGPTMDTRYWGLMAQDQDWLPSAFLVYDLETDQVTALRDLRSWSEEAREIDTVAISPLGTYFLAYLDLYCEEGELGDDQHPCGLMVYDRNLENGRSLLRIVGHSDTALDENGREVFVYQDIDTDTISMLDLESGQITPLHPIDFSHTAIGLHFSGRAYEKPGWVLVSTHDGDTASHTWMDDQVFALELKPDGQVIHLAHTHSIVDESQEHDYWAEPHASVNQDFTRVLFTSNWGRSGSETVEMYMVYTPAGWLP